MHITIVKLVSIFLSLTYLMQALEAMISAFPTAKKDYQLCLKVTKRIWVARHDVHPENR